MSQFGTVSVFVNGEFEAVVETNVSKNDLRDVVHDALNMAIDDIYTSVDNLDSCAANCLDVCEIGD